MVLCGVFSSDVRLSTSAQTESLLLLVPRIEAFEHRCIPEHVWKNHVPHLAPPEIDVLQLALPAVSFSQCDFRSAKHYKNKRENKIREYEE